VAPTIMASEAADASPVKGEMSSMDIPKDPESPALIDAVDNESSEDNTVEEGDPAVGDTAITDAPDAVDENVEGSQEVESDAAVEREQVDDSDSDDVSGNESEKEQCVPGDAKDAGSAVMDSSPQPDAVPRVKSDSGDDIESNSTNEASFETESSDKIEAEEETTQVASTTDGDASSAVHNAESEDEEPSSDAAESSGSPNSLGSGAESSVDSGSSTETHTSESSDDSNDWYDPSAGAGKTAENESDEGDDDDVTSRAAIALAAVAVAVNAQHSSPSAAAQAARALAPGIMPGAGMSPRRNEDMKTVSLQAVKHFLKTKASNSTIIQKLADGENDAFLQHLLLLEFFRIDDDTSEPEVPASPSAAAVRASESEGSVQVDGEDVKVDRGVFDEELAAIAAERVRSILAMIGGAYDSLAGLLPNVPKPELQENDEAEFDGIETPPIIPDLLPPCASTSSDATAEFFRECAGPCEIEDAAKHEDDTEPEKAEESHPNKTARDGKSSESGHSSASSVLSSMFTSVKRSSIATPRASLTGVFRKRNRRHSSSEKKDRDSSNLNESRDDDLAEGEYSVLIEREMLGLTVENVLERTVVRTVLPGGAAKSAGAQVGSLIVRVGNVPTKNLTHFETIDELRQSQRPLRLVMRQISTDALSLAREEMGRLIRGAGFGMITGGAFGADEILEQAQEAAVSGKRNSGRRPQIETYSRILHERWTCDDMTNPDATELPIHKAAEKLVWILTLLIYGLESEAVLTQSVTAEVESPREKQRHHHHDSKDYVDASKSVSKVLLDFMKKNVEVGDKSQEEEAPSAPIPMNSTMVRRGRKAPPPPPPPPRGMKSVGSSSIDPNKPLIQIGDVLHRTYTFLADPTSPPAALLRGEVIAFLCDVLDIDTGMELSEEESASSTAAGENAGPISDLGSAGSLLKLIILNCSMMRSPGCGMHDSDEHDHILKEQKRRFGYKRQFSSVDAHRLHAGNRFLAVVHRLAASRSLSARVTACSLGPVLWGHLDFPHQLQVRKFTCRCISF
jgi:hypothetical protein